MQVGQILCLLARESARQSVILLKNDGILPLEKLPAIAVIGPNADVPRHLLGDYSDPSMLERMTHTPLTDSATIQNFLEAWLPGEEGAAAVAEILFGESRPGGKLPINFPRSSASCRLATITSPLAVIPAGKEIMSKRLPGRFIPSDTD